MRIQEKIPAPELPGPDPDIPMQDTEGDIKGVQGRERYPKMKRGKKSLL